MEVHPASGSSPDLSFDLDLVAFAPERAEIVSMKRATNGFLELKVVGPAAAVLAVEATDDLNSFSGIGTVMITNGARLFLDVGSTNHAQRFYRLRQ
ncbi:MAG: hypothetical protein JWM16_1607 [Verrucomicrobiales bacterium]|nr:hypothetical protein [Verrucomicrobiales bacterium]